MNIEWVIPCRFVEVHDNLATIVGAGIDTFWLPQEPQVVGLMFALRVTAMAEELEGSSHRMLERVRDPEGNVVREMDGEFGAQALGPVQTPDWLQGIALPIIAQFPAPLEGTYTVTHQFDDSEHSLPLHVVHGYPPGVEPPPDVS